MGGLTVGNLRRGRLKAVVVEKAFSSALRGIIRKYFYTLAEEEFKAFCHYFGTSISDVHYFFFMTCVNYSDGKQASKQK